VGRFLFFAATLACAACSQDPFSTLDAPRQFFAGHKIGSSADYGIIKSNNPSDHVITVHGFADDAASCKEVADALNFNACKETGGEQCLNPYSCIALNQ
jgi:hypothetical protein